MKQLLIIFCFFLSVLAELSPQKFILAFIRLETKNADKDPLIAALAECLMNKMEVTGVEISEDEMKEFMIEKENFSQPTAFHRQISTAFFIAVDLCEFEIDNSKREKIKTKLLRLQENPEIDNYLECLQAQLKRHQRDHGTVEDFEWNHNCNSTIFTDLSEIVVQAYHEMKLTKCTLEEFGEFQRENAIDTEVILMLKASNKPFEEVVDFYVNEQKKFFENRLKCILEEIFDR